MSLKVAFNEGEIPLSSESNQFVDWLNAERTKRAASGAIGASALLRLLAAWYKLNKSLLANFFFDRHLTGSSEELTTLGFARLEKSGPDPFHRPSELSESAQNALSEAQSLVILLRRNEVAPYHIFVALLIAAAKSPEPDRYLGVNSGRVHYLGVSFKKHLKENGYSEAWEYWDRAFEPVMALGSRPSTAQAVSEGPTLVEDVVQPNPEPKIGGLFAPRRNATHDELCLNIDAYAGAIADTFTGAAKENDFVFALYAPWGRGKSKLMEAVAIRLQGEPARKLSMWRRLLSKVRLGRGEDNDAKVKESDSGKGYQCPFFSAWKYPIRPETWVHLYQKLLSEAQGDTLTQKLRISFRIGLLKHGWWPLITGFGLLAFSRLYWEMGELLFKGLGLAGLLILVSFFWNWSKLGKSLGHSYFSAPDHSQRLGLQAVIGQDLKDLLRVWIAPVGDAKVDARSGDCDFSRWIPGRLCLAIVVALVWTTLAVVAWKIHRHSPMRSRGSASASTTAGYPKRPVPSGIGLQSIADNRALVLSEAHSVAEVAILSNVVSSLQVARNPADTNNPLSPTKAGGELVVNANADHLEAARLNQEELQPKSQRDDGIASEEWARRMLFGLLGVTAIAVPLFAVWLAWSPRRPERVLLVVDDLDRCEPEQMLAVIESLRLFLDDPEMSRRMQVAMLLDRSILKQALLLRGRRRRSIKSEATDAAFFREQEDKLFVASLELPELTPRDVDHLAQRLIDREYRALLRQQKSAADEAAQKAPPPGSKVWRTESVPRFRFMRWNEQVVQLGNEIAAVEVTVPADASRTSKWQAEVDAAKAKAKALEAELGQLELGQQRRPIPKSNEVESVTFSNAERAVLKSILAKLAPAVATPRSIRAFVIRYQLVRLLLRHLEQEANPADVIPSLAARLFPKAGVELPKLDSMVQSAIDAVAGRRE
jgi:hypothetical protein